MRQGCCRPVRARLAVGYKRAFKTSRLKIMSATTHRRRLSFSLSRSLPLLLAAWLLVPAPGRAQSGSATDDLYQLFQVDLPPADVAIPTKKSKAEPVFKLLAKLYADLYKPKAWRAFCEKNLRYPRGKPTKALGKRPGDILADADARQVQLNVEKQFADIADALTPEGSLKIKQLGEIADNNQWDFKTAEEIAEWLDGKWLEHYVLKQIADRQSEYRVNDFGRNIETRLKGSHRDKFEADVAAMRGYQFHFISCYTGSRKRECKLKLFEALTRAQQLGGDESRAALVCGSDDPRAVELEIGQVWDRKNRVKVFGRHDLLRLGDRLRDWFDSGAKE